MDTKSVYFSLLLFLGLDTKSSFSFFFVIFRSSYEIWNFFSIVIVKLSKHFEKNVRFREMVENMKLWNEMCTVCQLFVKTDVAIIKLFCIVCT